MPWEFQHKLWTTFLLFWISAFLDVKELTAMVVELYWSPIAAQWHGKGKPVTEDTMCNHNLSFKEMNICKTGSYAVHTIKFNIKFFLAEQNFPSLKRDFLIFFKFYFLLLKELYQIKSVLVSWTPCWSPMVIDHVFQTIDDVDNWPLNALFLKNSNGGARIIYCFHCSIVSGSDQTIPISQQSFLLPCYLLFWFCKCSLDNSYLKNL